MCVNLKSHPPEQLLGFAVVVGGEEGIDDMATSGDEEGNHSGSGRTVGLIPILNVNSMKDGVLK